MARVPGFVQNMARMAILKYAQEKGHTVISSSLIDETMGKFMPQGAMGSAGKRPHGHSSEEEKMGWDEEAMKELQKIGDPAVREQVRLRVEKRAKMKGAKS